MLRRWKRTSKFSICVKKYVDPIDSSRKLSVYVYSQFHIVTYRSSGNNSSHVELNNFDFAFLMRSIVQREFIVNTTEGESSGKKVSLRFFTRVNKSSVFQEIFSLYYISKSRSSGHN